MNQSNDEQFMRQAIALAMRGRGTVERNPMVGCVIVRDGRVIGQGIHERFGGPHAEPNALANCTESPAGATAYVTLEPCCHLDKKTPPCVPKLIAAKLTRVVVGCEDPNPKVNGQGIAQLRAAGIEVTTNILGDLCRQLIAPFIALTTHHRPYVTLKWAQSADKKVAGPGGQRLQISNEASTHAVYRLRSLCDAIVVGINTVLMDDPILTTHGIGSDPARYVLDRQLRIELTSRLLQTIGQSPIIIATDPSMMASEKARQLSVAGAEVITAESFKDVLDHLHDRQATHVMVEPGPTLAASLLQTEYVDRVWIIRSPKQINDPTAPAAATLPPDFITAGAASLDGDHWTEYLNSRSRIFFAVARSADFSVPFSTINT